MKKALMIVGGYLAVGLAIKIYRQDPQLSSVLTWPLSLIPMRGSSAAPSGVPTLVANNPTQLLTAVGRAG